MSKIKKSQLRIPQELWAFIRKRAYEREISINTLIVNLLENYKKRYENKLTSCATIVSSNKKED